MSFEDQTCDYCGRSDDEVSSLMPDRKKGGCICDLCVKQGASLLAAAEQEEVEDDNSIKIEMHTPKEMYDHLNQYVIGQDFGKKTLCSGVYNHYKKLRHGQELEQKSEKDENDVELEKSNILMIGPSGSGKTYMVKHLAELFSVPFVIADATSFSQAGYVGDDVETILTRLVDNAPGKTIMEKIKRAETGIVFIDEIDKIRSMKAGANSIRDVTGEGVQQSLLKLIEGTIAMVPLNMGRKHPNAPMIPVDTSKILFVCGGAFSGLTDLIAKRVDKGESFIGIGAKKRRSKHEDLDYKQKLIRDVIHEDIIDFGMIPEFVGRVPVVVTLEELTKDELKQILTVPKNAIIKQYKVLFGMDDTELIMDEKVVDLIVEKAHSMKIGARALRSVMERILNEFMFEAPSNDDKSITITPEIVKDRLQIKSEKAA